MRQRCNDKTKRPKPKENQPGMLKIYAFCQKIQQRFSCPGRSAAGFTYLSMRMHPENCRLFPLKVATTLLSGSRKGATGV